jgi:Ca-activated chloride channel family protein
MKALFAACAVVLCAAPAVASSTVDTAPTEGTLLTREGKKVVPVPLDHTEVTIRVDGFIAEATVEQRFVNPYDHKIEAVYLFPLPTQAAVNGYEIRTSGRTIKGELRLRDEARKIYKDAANKGHVAALLTQERPNLFTQKVANIEPGAEIVVVMSYAQALRYDAGAYELVFPLVAGPRHVPKSSKLTREAAAAVQPQVLLPGMRSSHDVAIHVELDAGVPIQGVRSPSHAIEAAVAARTAKIALAAGDTIPNKDFILRYDVAGDRPEVAVVAHRAAGAEPGSFFLMMQPPKAPADAEVTPKELVFVIDTSSSMNGLPLEKARALVHTALGGMGPEDTFQIVRFDDAASALGAAPIANKPRNVQLALEWLDALEAGGGTDMTTGIRAALDFPRDPARLRVVAFLTDGYIGNEDEILAVVKEELGDARLFSFGVGSAVNRYLLEEMAELGRGAVQVVRPDEDTTAAVERFHDRIARPLLTDVTIDWGGLAVEGVTPAAIPDLFADQPVVLLGRYTAGGSAKVTLRGRMAGRKVTMPVDLALPDDAANPAVAAVWARTRIAELSREQLRKEVPAVKDEIVALALRHSLMTPYTAYVAVATHVKTDGVATTVAVPVEMPEYVAPPAGRHGGGIGYASGVIAQPYHNDWGDGGSYGGVAEVARPTEEKVEHPPPPTKIKPDPVIDLDTSPQIMAMQMKQCVTSAARSNPALRGKAKIKVSADGKVTVDGVESADFERCVAIKSKVWKIRDKVELTLEFQGEEEKK